MKYLILTSMLLCSCGAHVGKQEKEQATLVEPIYQERYTGEESSEEQEYKSLVLQSNENSNNQEDWPLDCQSNEERNNYDNESCC